MDHREAFEIASEVAPPHIDFVTSDLEGFLVDIVAGLSGCPERPNRGAATPLIAGREPCNASSATFDLPVPNRKTETMTHTALETIIDAAFEDRANINAATQGDIRKAVDAALHLLDAGKLRVAEKIAGAVGPGVLARASMAEEGGAAVVPPQRHGRDLGRSRRRDLVGQGSVQIRRLGSRRSTPRRAFARCRTASCAAPPISRRASC